MTIRFRTFFILIFTLFIFVFTVFIGFTINKESTKSVENQISAGLTQQAYQMANQLDQFMYSRYGEVSVLSNLTTFKEATDTQEITKLLNQMKSNIPTYSWIGFTNEKGIVKAATDNILLDVDISERPVFKEATVKPFIGDVHEAVLLSRLLPNPSGEPLQFVDISLPIFNDKKEFKGVLATHLSWEWAKEVETSVFQPLIRSKDKTEVFIVSKNNNTVLLGPDEWIGEKLDLKAVNSAHSGRNSWSLEEWSNGEKYLTGYSLADGFLNYSGLNWTVLVRQPNEVAFKSVVNLRNKVIILGCLCIILFAIIGWFLSGYITKPIKSLVRTAERLKNGETTEVPIIRGITEIEILSTSIKNLVYSLTRTKKDLGKMESIAQLDNLTGLPNRLALDNYLDNLELSNPKGKKEYAILYIDLDGFKPINDTYGHYHGDMLLKEVAKRFNSCIRGNDFISRLGGDEFVIFLSEVNSIKQVDIIGNRIIESLTGQINIEGDNIEIGCSIGIARWPTDNMSSYQVLRFADEALYKAKSKGKNQSVYYRE
ncbi:diguanylate cyclase [Bacillales bacterium AN1005]